MTLVLGSLGEWISQTQMIEEKVKWFLQLNLLFAKSKMGEHVTNKPTKKEGVHF